MIIPKFWLFKFTTNNGIMFGKVESFKIKTLLSELRKARIIKRESNRKNITSIILKNHLEN